MAGKQKRPEWKQVSLQHVLLEETSLQGNRILIWELALQAMLQQADFQSSTL